MKNTSLVVAVTAASVSSLVTILLGWNWSSVAAMYVASGAGSFVAMSVAFSLSRARNDDAEEIKDQIAALREMREKEGGTSETMVRHKSLVLQMNSREPRSRFGG